MFKTPPGYCRSLTRNEIGCALSLREAYRQVIASGCAAAVILEDDAVPIPALNLLLEHWRTIPNSVDLVSLFKGSGIIHRHGGYQLADIKLARAAATIECSCGYFIWRQTAVKLLEMTQKICSVADWPFDIREISHYVTLPDIVTHDHMLPTEIGIDRPGFISPPPPLARKIIGLKALLFITYLKHRKNYDSLYNYYERELRVRIKARMPWRYEIMQGYYRWPDKSLTTASLADECPARQRRA